MVSYKKIFIVLFFILFIFILSPDCFAAPISQPQFWSLDSYSPTADVNWPDYARSTQYIITPYAAIIFPREKNVQVSSCYVRFDGNSISLSDGSKFLVVAEGTKNNDFPVSYPYFALGVSSEYTSFNTGAQPITMSYSSVDMYSGSFSNNNLIKAGVGVFSGANNFDNTTIDYFTRYATLQSVFEDGSTLYYRESKNIDFTASSTVISITAYNGNNQSVIYNGSLADWYYDPINKVYYLNLPQSVYDSINSIPYTYFKISAQHTVSNNLINRDCYVYAPNTGEGQSGSPGGGGEGGSFDDTEIVNGINDINDNLESVDNSIQEQTDFLTDNTVSDSSFTLPSDSTQDITQDGINNIFTLIYNGFTSGTAPDIVLPIPFTNKSITISANYTYNILNGNQAFSVIYALIQAFYWYFISVFIVSDISRKITKIKSGNLENIANSNIKEEML